MADSARPEPIHASKQSINNFAESLAYQFRLQPGDALEPLVQRLGGLIVVRNPIVEAGSKPESIVVRSSSDFTIYVPGMTSLERDRFTIAHELGHLFLHFPLFAKKHPGAQMVATRWVDENDKEQQRAEWEANWFAAGFIMPQTVFKEVYAAYAGKLGSTAVRFGVSAAAAQIRAKTLGLAVNG